jgi:hypothetical protein
MAFPLLRVIRVIRGSLLGFVRFVVFCPPFFQALELGQRIFPRPGKGTAKTRGREGGQKNQKAEK